MIDKLKQWLERHFGTTQHKKRQYMLIIAVIGLLFIIMSNFFSYLNKQGDKEQIPDVVEENEQIEEVSLTENVGDLEAQYEADLESMLNKMKDVSEAEVMINVDATNEQVYEKDLITGTQKTDETDKSGGIRKVEDDSEETKLVYVRNGDEEVPVLVQTKKPAIRGVFVIAKGADNLEVKKWMVESISRVLDVPTYRISVMPK